MSICDLNRFRRLNLDCRHKLAAGDNCDLVRTQPSRQQILPVRLYHCCLTLQLIFQLNNPYRRNAASL